MRINSHPNTASYKYRRYKEHKLENIGYNFDGEECIKANSWANLPDREFHLELGFDGRKYTVNLNELEAEMLMNSLGKFLKDKAISRTDR